MPFDGSVSALLAKTETTAQMIFDESVGFILRQRRPSVVASLSPETNCRYRTPSGLRCAVGALIGDDEYRPAMEGQTARMVVAGIPRLKFHADLLRDLQRAHDGAAEDVDFLPSFTRYAMAVAYRHGLTWNFGRVAPA